MREFLPFISQAQPTSISLVIASICSPLIGYRYITSSRQQCLINSRSWHAKCTTVVRPQYKQNLSRLSRGISKSCQYWAVPAYNSVSFPFIRLTLVCFHFPRALTRRDTKHPIQPRNFGSVRTSKCIIFPPYSRGITVGGRQLSAFYRFTLNCSMD